MTNITTTTTTTTTSSSVNNSQCGICVCTLHETETPFIVMPKCQHRFHFRCIRTTLWYDMDQCYLCVKTSPESGESAWIQSLLNRNNAIDLGDNMSAARRAWNALSLFTDVANAFDQRRDSDDDDDDDDDDKTGQRVSKNVPSSGYVSTPSIPAFEQYLNDCERNETKQQQNNNNNNNNKSARNVKQQLQDTIHTVLTLTTPELGRRRGQKVAELILERRSAVEIVREYRFMAHDLVAEGVAMNTLLECGYTLHDFLVLGCTWSTFLSLGLTSTLWKQHRKNLPVSQMVAVFGINVCDVLNDLCNNSLDLLAKMCFSANDLVSLQATAPQLIALGMTSVATLAAFDQAGIGMAAWRDKLKLSSELLAVAFECEPIQLTDDVKHGGVLKWIKIRRTATGLVCDHAAEFHLLYPNFVKMHDLSSSDDLAQHIINKCL